MLQLSGRGSHCEWKGRSVNFHVLAGGKTAADAAWAYPDPHPTFTILRNFFAFYPARMDRFLAYSEEATPQPGDFYRG